MTALDFAFDQAKQRVAIKLQQTLDDQSQHIHLQQALEYAVAAGGKRLRPFLVYACSDLWGSQSSYLDTVAAAIELIHCYSLVHDDLPDMDNSPLRRGRPSCWKQYDPTTAILVGDALQTLAFELLGVRHPSVTVETQLKLIHLVAQAAGANGMVAGQMMDMYPQSDWNPENLFQLQYLKTGKLIEASCVAAGVVANAPSHQIEIIQKFAYHIGLMYQITDDLLDVSGNETDTGKPVAQDQAKFSIVKILGIPQAQQQAEQLHQENQNLLAIFGQRAQTLLAFSKWILTRMQ
jgi:farnesyl diphosphate synthase